MQKISHVKVALTYFCGMFLCLINDVSAQNSLQDSIPLFEFQDIFFGFAVPADTLFAKENFTFTETNSFPRCLCFEQGSYSAKFYTEPGRTYKIHPPSSPKKNTLFQSPSLQKITIHANISLPKDSLARNELNSVIRSFDEIYEPFLASQTLSYFNEELAREKLDSFYSDAINKTEYSQQISYFREYFYYKMANLYFHLKGFPTDSLINKYLLHKAFQPEIPPYAELCRNLLSGYFSSLQQKQEFRNLFEQFKNQSYTDFNQYLKKDPLLQNDTLREFILLKECYDLFYKGTFPQKKLLDFTDSLCVSRTSPSIRNTAKKIRNQFTWLSTGTKAPEINATNIQGNPVSLLNDNELLTYLGFLNLGSMDCRKEIQYLKYLSAKHSKYIRIITVIDAASAEQIAEFSKSNDIQWDIIVWKNNPDLIYDYRVKTSPVFFLIDSEGTILDNPAPNPSENFEYKLFLLLRSGGRI